MDLTSLQVCMDSSEWLQGTIEEECGMDSSSPCSGDTLTCTRPLVERRLRPPHDQALKCPRCDSTNTKFCYYNNYSLSQPRYICKTCRRYWTKGGMLRNIPVGGGCRRNTKVSTKKPSDNQSPNPASSSSHNPTDLQLSFPKLHPAVATTTTNSFMESKYNDFMERRLEAIVGSSRNNYDFMGNGDQLGLFVGLGGDHMSHHHGLAPPSVHGFCSPCDGNGGNSMDTWHHQGVMMLPYDHANVQDQHDTIMDVKPNTKILSLDWQEQGRSETGNEYLNNLASWNGMMNSYGPSTKNPLV